MLCVVVICGVRCAMCMSVWCVVVRQVLSLVVARAIVMLVVCVRCLLRVGMLFAS